MTLPEILITAAVGMLVVFTVLVILMCAINIMAAIFKKLDSKKKNGTEQEPVASVVPALSSPAPGSCGGVSLNNVSDRDAAMIMAIVADELEVPLNELRFISITCTEEN